MVSSTLMRRALGQFATGVTVVTTVSRGGAPAGCTVSAFCSLSLDPPLVLVCIGKNRRMHGLLTSAHGYAVNVLRDDQGDVARAFADARSDRFLEVGHRTGRNGIPLLAGAIAHIECDRYAVADGGDHAIVVGLVHALDVAQGLPLLYSQGVFLDPPGLERAQPAPDEWLGLSSW
jgi:flavin reductase (DIM6/NTAB) family NADH-FMN oxidoreductase RutF